MTKKNKGWKNESKRHSLAAKGISTGRKQQYGYNTPLYYDAINSKAHNAALNSRVPEWSRNLRNGEKNGHLWDSSTMNERENIIKMGNSWTPSDMRYARLTWGQLNKYRLVKEQLNGLINKNINKE